MEAEAEVPGAEGKRDMGHSGHSVIVVFPASKGKAAKAYHIIIILLYLPYLYKYIYYTILYLPYLNNIFNIHYLYIISYHIIGCAHMCLLMHFCSFLCFQVNIYIYVFTNTPRTYRFWILLCFTVCLFLPLKTTFSFSVI